MKIENIKCLSVGWEIDLNLLARPDREGYEFASSNPAGFLGAHVSGMTKFRGHINEVSGHLTQGLIDKVWSTEPEEDSGYYPYVDGLTFHTDKGDLTLIVCSWV